MYLDYYKLKEMPFKISPDPRFLYMTPQHSDALERCQFVINERGGLVVIYGAIGMGKTTIARRLLDITQENPSNQVAMLITPALNTKQALLRAIMSEFDVPQKRSYDRSLSAFQDFILGKVREGKNLVLIIDEAQELTPKMFGVIHTLLNFESNTEKFLQIVLIGQNELATHIDQMKAIRSRVGVFGSLQNLMPEDTNEMIAFRWHIASAAKSSHPFSETALEAIYKYSKGLPREINKLCHESLLNAMIAQTHEVSADMVAEAAKELRIAEEGEENV